MSSSELSGRVEAPVSTHDGGVGSMLFWVGVAVVAIAISARIDTPIPGSPVPQSAQTFAVLVVGGVLGLRVGSLALAAYLTAGAVGLPVFADGAGGWTHLVGPTAGYLFGFLIAAAGVGWLRDRGWLNRYDVAVGAMVAGHLLILGLGWAGLSRAIGGAEALAGGVTPFLWGGIVKSVAAGLVVTAWIRRRGDEA